MNLQGIKRFATQNRWLGFFIVVHTIFAILLGRLYALAPDEGGYLYTFNRIYTLPISTNAQTGSGWITAPTVFLWIAYLPAKVLNMIGVPDYLSIRILSILITSLTLYLFLNIQKHGQFVGKFSRAFTFAIFFIPSIFLWSSVGLRESFIFVELAVFVSGFNFLMRGMNRRGILLLFIGSYGLVSTKNYLWACLMAALILCTLIFLFQSGRRRQMIVFIIAGFVAPLIAFAGTTSAYALDYIFHSNISETGARSGDSISQVYVDTPGTGSGTGTGTGSGTGTGTGSGTGTGTGTGTGSGIASGAETKPTKQLITFHGDYTLIALHFYLINNPDAPFSRISRAIHLDRKIQKIWDEKIALGLIQRDNQVGTDTSSLNGHILEPGKISRPLTLIWPAFVFLFGPFPFIGDPGIAVFISSLESPLWWAFYALVIFQFIRFRKIKFLQDPQIVFTLIFLAGEIAFSALVEVNLGTSFRHRSILLVPLIFLYVRLAQRAHEQKDLELGVI